MISFYTWLPKSNPFGLASVWSEVVVKPLVDRSVCGIGSASTSAPGPRGTPLLYEQALKEMVVPGLLSLFLPVWKFHPINKLK